MLQHLIDLPIKILNQPAPKFIRKGDRRGTENISKWAATTRPGGLLVGLVQSVASPSGIARDWTTREIDDSVAA